MKFAPRPSMLRLIAFVSLGLVACPPLPPPPPVAEGEGEGEGEGDVGPPPEIVNVSVSGSLEDFATGDPVTPDALTVLDVFPQPIVQLSTPNPNDFLLTQVPPYSIFVVRTDGGAGYTKTNNAPITTEDADVRDVVLTATSNAWLQQAATEFGVVIDDTRGILILQLIGEDGAPQDGVQGTSLLVNGQAQSAYFLDIGKTPNAALTATTITGYVLFFNLPDVATTISSQPAAAYEVVAPTVRIDAGYVTIATGIAYEGGFQPPQNVSFANDVVPIFNARGCEFCHAGANENGREDGGLDLFGSDNKLYSELVEETSPNFGRVRVNLQDPSASVLLQVPSLEVGFHPTQMLNGPADPDYQTIFGWILEGAQQN